MTVVALIPSDLNMHAVYLAPRVLGHGAANFVQAALLEAGSDLSPDGAERALRRLVSMPDEEMRSVVALAALR